MSIEMARPKPCILNLRCIIDSDVFQNSRADLPCAIGKSIDNEVFLLDLAQIHHLLIAGATGQGKTNCLHDIIISLLFKKTPDVLKLVLIDSKKCEFEQYASLANQFLMELHCGNSPIVTEIEDIINSLNELCQQMDERFELLRIAHVRNVNEYNRKIKEACFNTPCVPKFMPYVVVIIDEFADLVMAVGDDFHIPLMRLTQLGHVVGIHLVIATERTTPNIIKGCISANFPARLAFRVITNADSRTTIGVPDACQLLGNGDMLCSYMSELTRIQCALVNKTEINRVIDSIVQQKDCAESM